ncbi:hypothetical protein PGT21_011883 [Puccinia graminis f. sp. tritici]|uniref:Uncharacterized protein n=1 Tax=Puccinia graminis f. sp. tritici TaxID=56615 RepID=A0A5B0NIY0_PUCGR|nr:hypothetical protein PGT21_011883 [Puccinia graminis f. sp. tritici]
MPTSKLPSPSVSTVDNTKPPTVPLTQPNHPDSPSSPSPINSTLPLPALPDCSIPIYPTAPACPVNLEIAAIGSLTIENDDIDSITARIAPEYSQATLDYYNDIQEYLQQANADETETKKKKKKKKKKKANPTSTPNNPILFYTAEIFLSCLVHKSQSVCNTQRGSVQTRPGNPVPKQNFEDNRLIQLKRKGKPRSGLAEEND